MTGLNTGPSVLGILAFLGCELVVLWGKSLLWEFVPKYMGGIEEPLSLARQLRILTILPQERTILKAGNATLSLSQGVWHM